MACKGQMVVGWRSRAAATMAILFFVAAMIQTCSSRSATPAAEFEAWGESLREKFQDDQPHAVDAALAALKRQRAKTDKAGASIIHLAGAKTGSKVEMAAMISSQHSRGSPPPCDAPISVTLSSVPTLDDAFRAICSSKSSQCPSAALVLDATGGDARSTTLHAERLLVRITQSMSIPCTGGALSTQGWSVLIVSDLGSDRSSLPDGAATAGGSGGKNAIQKAIKEGVLAGAAAWLVPELYEHATKSVIYKAGSAALIPFIASGPEGGDDDQAPAPPPKVSKGGSTRNGGAKARREIVKGCIAEMMNKGSGVAARRHTLEGLRDNFLGQRLAVEKVSGKVKNRKGGWGQQTKPLVLVFLGPSGTGKTELAKQIASAIHGQSIEALMESKRFVTIPMGQYKDRNSAANLVGPPVGIEGTGQLTGALLDAPDAVVLLDEFEKAHPEAISDVLLSAFEDSGGFKDTKLDKYVPTARATFIINTNIGAQTVLRREEYLRSNADALTHKDKVVMDIEEEIDLSLKDLPPGVNPFSRPEFRGRVDEWVVFYPYSPDQVEAVTRLALQTRVLSYYLNGVPPERRIAVGWEQRALRVIAGRYGGRDGTEGFRPVFRAVEGVHELLREAWEEGVIAGGDGAVLTEGGGDLHVLSVPGYLGDSEEQASEGGGSEAVEGAGGGSRVLLETKGTQQVDGVGGRKEGNDAVMMGDAGGRENGGGAAGASGRGGGGERSLLFMRQEAKSVDETSCERDLEGAEELVRGAEMYKKVAQDMQEKAKAMSEKIEFSATKEIVEEVKVSDMAQESKEQMLKIERLESELSLAHDRIQELTESYNYMSNIALVAGIAAIFSATTLTLTSVVVAKAVLSYTLVPMLIPIGALAAALAFVFYYYRDFALMVLNFVYWLFTRYPFHAAFLLLLVWLWLRVIAKKSGEKDELLKARAEITRLKDSKMAAEASLSEAFKRVEASEAKQKEMLAKAREEMGVLENKAARERDEAVTAREAEKQARSLAEAKSELAKKAEQRAEAAEASLKQLKEG